VSARPQSLTLPPSAHALAFALSIAAAARHRPPARRAAHVLVQCQDGRLEVGAAPRPRPAARGAAATQPATHQHNGAQIAAGVQHSGHVEAAAAEGGNSSSSSSSSSSRCVAPCDYSRRRCRARRRARPTPSAKQFTDARRCPLPTAHRSPRTQIPRTSKYIRRRSSSNTSDVGCAPSRARRNARCGACTPRRDDSDSGPLLSNISAGHLSLGWGERRAERRREKSVRVRECARVRGRGRDARRET